MSDHLEILTGHQHARHILIAPRQHDHPVEPVRSCGGLDLIRDEVPRLERVGHAVGAHTNTITDADGTELVANQSGFRDGLLDAGAEGEEMFVAS